MGERRGEKGVGEGSLDAQFFTNIILAVMMSLSQHVCKRNLYFMIGFIATEFDSVSLICMNCI